MWNSPSFLNTVSVLALWVAAVCGGLTVVSSFIGGLAASRASDLVRNDAEIRIADANARAEEARLKAAKIEEGLQWRHLSIEQHAILVRELRGKLHKAWTTFVGDDPEATLYRLQFDNALREAGVETSFFSGWKNAAGVSVLGNPGPERDALSEALKEAGIPHVVEPPHSIFGKEYPALVIGTKAERL
jgi:hypothetical protein